MTTSTPTMSSPFLKRPLGGDPADQCREMGIKVGDTIQGREVCGRKYWHEARLTLIWIGDKTAVWTVQERANDSPEWSEPDECACWTLDCRKWRKVFAAASANPHDAPEPNVQAQGAAMRQSAK